MKLKYYMRGVGVGIIFTTLLFLGVILPNKTKMSEEEIRSEAKKLGMVESLEEDNLASLIGGSQVTNTPSASPVADPTSLPNKVSEEKDAQEEKITVTASPAPTPTPTQMLEKPVSASNKKKKIKLVIETGMSSEIVAEQAEEKGLVKDAKLLNQYLFENDYSDYILVGTFRISEDSSYEEIGNIITGKNEN